MPVLAFEPIPGEIQALIERRAEFGLDHYDEVWDGVLHIIPPPSTEHQRVGVALVRLLDSVARSAGLELTLNVGIGEDAHNFRTPDLVVHRQDAAPQWHATAALAVEILSPRDTAWHKLDFYADHNVDELLYVDLEKREVTWMALRDGGYQRVERSALIDLGIPEVTSHLGWAEVPKEPLPDGARRND
ncbi:MAG TPA: Uma2 family endonuclease [Solirubrobacteraceae bacterium]|nr:Uma2 family endonuclease [Solirubrobacteraceae bacterium]